ncbi:MAG TPA: GNAT family N-acetyltransferase [Gaiellaceae bacterium]|nr:GNAT family N-acetyltransferase [Gaiellaceae bacterium]
MSLDLVAFGEEHLLALLRLYEAEGWPSFPRDPALAGRAFSAPGVVSLVALADGEVVGFARLLTDGALEAYLCELVVAETQRRQGVGRALIEEAFAQSGARRLDVLAEEGSEAFYRSFEHRRFAGYRLYPGTPARRRPTRTGAPRAR